VVDSYDPDVLAAIVAHERLGWRPLVPGMIEIFAASLLDQALNLRVLQGNALDDLAMDLELDRSPACHGVSRLCRTV
jgi:hypothetical protein